MAMQAKLALGYSATSELVDLFKRQLELCQVKEGENVLLHSVSNSYPHYPAAFMGAALALGADVFQVVHPRGVPERAVVDAWKRADLVIEMSPVPMNYTNIMKETLDSGTRVLRVSMKEEVLRRLTPNEEMRKRVEAGARIMDAGKKMRITSPHGTDLTLYKEGREGMGLYSIADKPGRWDHWPSGMVVCAPIEDEGEGVLVLAPGDVLFKDRYVRDPVHIEVRDGRITSIEGGLEAELLNEWFGKFNDPNAYSVSHVGWGCEKRADWLQPIHDIECYYGNMVIAFGSNQGAFRQGRTASRAHHDFPCRFHSYWVDELQIMDQGEFVTEGIRYTGAE